MNEKEVRIAHRILLDLLITFHQFCESHKLKYYIIGGTLLGAVRHKGFIPWDVDADVAMPREDYEKMLSLVSEFPQDYFIQNINTEKHFHTPKTKIIVNGAKKDNPDNYLASSRTGLNLDIFPLDVPPSEINKRKIQRLKIKFFKFILSIKLKMKKSPMSTKAKIKHSLRTLLRVILYPITNKIIINTMTRVMTKFNKKDSGLLCSMASHYDYNKQVMSKEIYGDGQEIEFEGKILIAPDKIEEYLTQIYGDYMKTPSVEKRQAMYRNLKLTLDDAIKIKYL